jgi:NADPH-dependent curcumin reductase CurA
MAWSSARRAAAERVEPVDGDFAARATAREIRLAGRPQGAPRESDFELAEVPIPAPAEGELLVRNTWMSIDPSTRIRMQDGGSDYLPPFEVGAALESWAVGEVVQSRAPGFDSGDAVLHALGWREYALLRVDGPGRTRPMRIEVDEITPARAYLGPLSWVGLTSYVGLLNVAELRQGDVVFVSAAAGAVGSLAVQIAKLRGHVVIGSAGSEAKVRFLRDTLGCDEAFCYRDGDVSDLLRCAAPDGIDVYFDNVGGHHLEAALDSLRMRGRVALCGAISDYNRAEAIGPRNLFNAVAKGLTLRGFLARMYADQLDAFRAEMRGWLAQGRIVYPETIFDRLEQAPRALIAQLAGENVGKVLVRLS